MKKRKALALWLAAIFMVSVIAGCSGGGAAGGQTESASGENGGGDKLPVRYLLPGSA
ncbi:ABC transporter substrate-binding protein, partial [Clostridium perfringens]